MLARDLVSDEYEGLGHIRALMNLESDVDLELVKSFLEVITHGALLDCLSIDTFVGALYSFVSGTNGNRAIPFFGAVGATLLEGIPENHLSGIEEATLVALTQAVCEVVKREQRPVYHDEFPELLELLEELVAIAGENGQEMGYQIAKRRVRELRTLLDRANGLLVELEEPQAQSVGGKKI
jgi:hypothetical protein